MAKVKVSLPNRYPNGVVNLDIKQLKIERIVYLRFENDSVIEGSFSEIPGLSPYIVDRIYAVTPSEDNGYAEIGVQVQNHQTIAETLRFWTFWEPQHIVEATAGRFDEESINALADKVIAQHEIKEIIKPEFIYGTPLRRIMTVARRLCFCKAQASTLEYFRKAIDVNNALKKDHSEQQLLVLRWTGETESQILYLLLTCFDILGQKDQYFAFEDWVLRLRGKEHPLVSNISDENFYDTMRALKEEYLNDQGVSRSFKQYLLNELPVPARDALLDSIVRSKREFYPQDTGHRIDEKYNSIEKKISTLFDLRNKFTHQGIDVRSAIFFRTYRDSPILRELNRPWLPIDEQVVKGVHKSVNVKGWPDPLYDAVQAGLIKMIEDLLATYKN